MKRPNLFVALTYIAAVAVLAANCVTSVAPGGTEDVNSRVAGILVDTGSAPASGASVRLLPVDFNPLVDTLETVAVTALTDSAGKYTLTVPRSEQDVHYTLEALQKESGRRLLKTGIVMKSASDTTFVDPDTLRAPAAIAVEFTGGTFSGSGYLYIPGTSYSVFVDSLNGRAVLDSVAAENVYALCFAATATASPDTIRHDLYLPEGKTVLVNNPGWRYRTLIRINTSASGVHTENDLTGFPLLVRLNNDNFDFSQCAASGSDLRFSKTDNTPIAFEIERWNVDGNPDDAADIWIRIDTVHADDSLQSFYMYWGMPDATTESDGAAVFTTGNGFEGVWHLNENPASGGAAIKDRTSNGYNGTPDGSMTEENVVPGVIGNALQYDGIDDNISAGQLNISGQYTLSCWINFDDLDTARRCIWKEYSYTLWYHSEANGVRVEHFTQTDEEENAKWMGFYQDGGTERPISIGSWFFLTGAFDGNRIRLFINGELLDSTEIITASPVWSNSPLLLGGRNGELVKGIMDEVRVENRARSPEWIHLSYENQRGNSVLVKIEN